MENKVLLRVSGSIQSLCCLLSSLGLDSVQVDKVISDLFLSKGDVSLDVKLT